MTNIVTSLQELSPMTFENLVFDLMQSLGVENLTWRTPGADGGRDIEGDLPARDLSGGLVYQRWFIECKRYTSSIDWPTVWGKAAYAQNGGADFLLIVTTSTLSPTCESEVTKWNLRRERPVIRAWRAYDLERMLGQFSAVATKYGLSTSGDGEGKAFQDLAFEAAKLIQSAYSAAEFEVDSSIYLEAAAALAELLSARMDEVSNYGSIKLAQFVDEFDTYEWLDKPTKLPKTDRFGLRAIFSAYRASTNAKVVRVAVNDNTMTITSSSKHSIATSSRNLMRLIAIWSNLEITFHPKEPEVTIIAQTT